MADPRLSLTCVSGCFTSIFAINCAASFQRLVVINLGWAPILKSPFTNLQMLIPEVDTVIAEVIAMRTPVCKYYQNSVPSAIYWSMLSSCLISRVCTQIHWTNLNLVKSRPLLCARIISEKAEQNFYSVNIGVFVEAIESCYFLT